MVALLAYLDARSHERYVVIFDDLKRYSRDVEFHLKLRRISMRELEAEIGKVVDRMMDVTNTRALKAFEDRIEALERDKLFALEMASRKPEPVRPFGEMFELSTSFLANPYDSWKNGGSKARNVVIRLAFEGRLEYTRETGCLNTKKSNVFRVLDELRMSGKAVVPPERLELSLLSEPDFESGASTNSTTGA